MEKKYHINYNFLKDPVPYAETRLVQLGRLYCVPSEIIRQHAHIYWYELTVITDGEGEISTNGYTEKVKKGDIYFSCPGDFHEIRSSEKNPLKYDFFSFSTENPTGKKELKAIVSGMQGVGERVFTDPVITSSISHAISEITEKPAFFEDMLSSLFEQIILRIIRNFRTEKRAQKKHKPSQDVLCFQITHYIDTHIHTIESLDVLAEKFNYNYSYLSDIFKKTTGNTIVSYYQSRRLDAARLLLSDGQFNIGQISEMLGYASLYSFSKSFKNKYGISPKNYSKSLSE